MVADTPVAVIDFETTGLRAGSDRVVEVSMVRIEPGKAPQLVVDSLVNPGRPVEATDVHGITDADVADAPRFEEVAGNVLHALCDAMVASYNVYFDIKFLEYELRRANVAHSPPHLCLMYLRPMLGLGRRCTLHDACVELGVSKESHQAAIDALAAAALWAIYRQKLGERSVRTFADLANLKSYKFIQSFGREPVAAAAARGVRATNRLKPRRRGDPTACPPLGRTSSRADAHHEYWDALQAILADFTVSDDEVAYLSAKRGELDLTIEEVRSLHGRAFASVIYECVEDKRLDDDECLKLQRLHSCLQKVGWAPGQASGKPRIKKKPFWQFW
jgi:DNA polymerase-3 subunit epsilon